MTIERVVEKLLVEAEMQLEQKGVQLSVNDEARGWLADHGYDPKMGARPMARLIQEQIKRPLAEELLFGKLTEGGQVTVSVSEDGKALALSVTPSQRPVLPQPLEPGSEVKVAASAAATVSDRGRTMRPLERSYGVISTVTASPVRMRM